MIYGDYHTHTTYSHGKDSIEANVIAAKKLGLKEIAITDHGLRHMFHGLSRKKIVRAKDEIASLRDKHPDINILFGVEANIIGRDGTMDLTGQQQEMFDIILAGYHVAVWGKSIREQIGYLAKNQAANIFHRYSKRHIKSNTRAYVELIKNNPIAILTHINFRTRADVVEVAKAARDYGTFIELSGKRTGCSDEEIAQMADTGVKFILDSDAHSAAKVGDIAFAQDIIGRLNIPYEQIANWDKQPEFRKPLK